MDWNVLPQILAHLQIVHHVRGRVRVRLLPGIMAVLPKLNGANAEQWLTRIPGVLDLRLNLAAASLVIQYDAARIQPQWWERLIVASGQDLPALFAEVGMRQGLVRNSRPGH